eukprot:CAMPEP_0202084194 /NCGR_PEP_ID=MMETSP0964-20121228/26852_1 /ASSEMBLY_ACC=CAM_ASM_000500 /TAXON_ID=4773 /ORGANISM="Schizochytrium aggregatum, Strain ATCC28209" /LENGTH=67 /DNA_ID=CAMNT_0048651955 /DNA_START=27 /DNA_END=227 /DNA_ORIENTATION=-
MSRSALNKARPQKYRTRFSSELMSFSMRTSIAPELAFCSSVLRNSWVKDPSENWYMWFTLTRPMIAK